MSSILKFVASGVALALLFVAWVYPEVPTASYALGAVLVALLGAMAWMNQRALKNAMQNRTVKYGTNAAVTVGLVVGILIVLNFLNYNHFIRKDFTKDKLHSLSDQTVKVLKGLNQEVHFTVFVKTAERDLMKGLLDNYVYNSKQIKVEYVDPDRDPTRAKALNVKKYGTVIVQAGKRDTRVEEATEEKLTNAMLNVLKDKTVTICSLTGHGEKTFEGTDADSYSTVKKELGTQNYSTKTVNLLEEGKIPAECTVTVILGPTKALFDKEQALLKEYLDKGGRALIALDPNLKSEVDENKEIKSILSDFGVDVKHNLVLDPTSRLLGVNASVALVGTYSKDHPITKDFETTSLFPLSSTIDLKQGQPTSLKSWWLAKSTPKAFAKNNFKEIATGKVVLDEKKDLMGPHVLAVAVEGSRTPEKKSDHEMRLVVLGTSQLASNRWVNYAGNLDFFMNSVSWLANDESLISIRAKEENPTIPSLSQVQARWIQLITMILVPGGVLLLGFMVWLRRKKL